MRTFFSFLILFLFFTTQITMGEVVKDTSGLKILTPSLSKRTIRKLRLDNALEVLLVSDPETPYAAAALSVGVGSSSDPLERAGLAHYTEHMLFLGNAKYPEEEGFSHFLDSYGGKRNAFTMEDRTVYMFSISDEGFDEGLDRFAHFFIAPSFTESGLKRECRAIHQEFCKNLPNDDWRMYYLKKALCNHEHPFHAFSIGNLDTLGNVSHEEIATWYKNTYSSNLMRLCIYSNRSLDDLEAVVTPLFNKIENKHLTRNGEATSLFIERKEKSCCFITPVQERCCLELSWELPKKFARDTTLHIDQLIGHILGHEGEGTLLAELKAEGLAHKLACGKQKTGVEDGIFLISIELTNKGVDHYEEVISRCFEKIHAVHKRGVEPYIYDEVQKVKEIEYCYQTRGDLFDYVSEHATSMIDEPIESYPRHSLFPTSFNKEACYDFLALLTPEKAHYMLLAPSELTKIASDKKDFRTHVAYAERVFAPELIKKWSHPTVKQGLALPPPNPFLPTKLNISEVPLRQGVDFDLLNHHTSDKGVLYIARDHSFLTPHASWRVDYKSPYVNPTIDNSGALIDLFVLAFNEAVNERLYSAKLAHLTFSLAAKEDGFTLFVDGFEEKIPLLMNILTQELATIQLSPMQFDLYKESLLKEYECKSSQSPLGQASEMVSSILYQNYQNIEQRLEQLSSLTLEETNLFCKTLFKKGYIKASCYTCNEGEKAKDIWNTMIERLRFAPYAKKEQTKKKLARFATMGCPTYLENRFPMAAGGLMVTVDFGDFTFEKRAIQEILSKALEEPFFSELRTRQQTAYIVTNWAQELERHLYNFFAIQSSSHDPRDLLSRFELFLESFLVNLESEHLPEERFEMIKKSLIKQLNYPQFNFSMMGHLFHTLALDYEGDLNWLKKRASALEKLSYKDFLQKVYQTMRENRQERIAVLIKGTFEEEAAPFSYEFSQSIHSIKERLEYK